MAARKLLSDVAHALRAFLDLDDDGEIAPWERAAVFRLDRPERALWADLPCAENPPRCYLLMTRQENGERFHELLWAVGGPDDAWPVVEVSEHGDAQVLAASAADYVDALLFTGGRLAGGSEEDLLAARAEAAPVALAIGDDVADELDREPADPEALGERCEEAQDRFSDLWLDAVEGLE